MKSFRLAAKTCRRFLSWLKRRAYSRLFLHRNVDHSSGPAFSIGEWYLKQYPDVAAPSSIQSDITCGMAAKEGRDPNAEVQHLGVRRYLSRRVGARGMNPFVHYVQFGLAEGRRGALRKNYAAWIDDYDRLSDEDRAAFSPCDRRATFPNR